MKAICLSGICGGLCGCFVLFPCRGFPLNCTVGEEHQKGLLIDRAVCPVQTVIFFKFPYDGFCGFSKITGDFVQRPVVQIVQALLHGKNVSALTVFVIIGIV